MGVVKRWWWLLVLVGCGERSAATPEAPVTDAVVTPEPDGALVPVDVGGPTVLPGDPGGPAPPKARWSAPEGPREPILVPYYRVENAGETLSVSEGLETFFRSSDPRVAGEPVMDPESFLRHVRASTLGGATASAKGGFLYAVYSGDLFLLRPAASAWTRLPCPAGEPSSPCGRTVETLSGALVMGRNDGVFRSTDSGASWSKVLVGSACAVSGEGARVLSRCEAGPIAYSKDDGATFTNLTAPGGVVLGTSLLAYTSGSIHRSTDDGLTWKPVWSDATTALAGLVARGKRAFAWSSSKAGRLVLVRSTDDALTFDRLEPDLPAGQVSLGDGGRVYAKARRSDDDGATWADDTGFPKAALYSAVDGTAVWAAGRRVHLSKDGGKSWKTVLETVTKYAPDGSVSGLTVDAVTHTTLVAHAEAVVRSNDEGATWSPATALPSAKLASGGGTVIAWTDLQLATSRDGGVSWSTHLWPSGLAYGQSLATETGAVLAFHDRKASRSEDGGATWTSWALPMTVGRVYSVGTLLFSVGNNLHRSTDGGHTWVEQRPFGLGKPTAWPTIVLPYGSLGLVLRFVNEPAADGVPLERLYASIDGGASFHPYSDGLLGRYVYGGVVDAKGVVYLGTSLGMVRLVPG